MYPSTQKYDSSKNKNFENENSKLEKRDSSSKNGNEKEIKESSENIKIIDTEESNYWVSNDKVKKCHYCEKEFNSIFSKKHHCRICGNVFCYDCCQKNIKEYKGKNKI